VSIPFHFVCFIGMVSQMKFIGAARVAILLAMSGMEGVSGTGIEPELEPTSDKKFFNKDYPRDVSPQVYNHFGHPYPEVQDNSKYDSDFVKDENNDGGEWKAQSEYDTLKNKLGKEKAKVQNALQKERQEAAELKKAKGAEEAADAAEEHADSNAGSAKAADSAAEGDLEGVQSGVDAAAAEVEKEAADLENCKKQLAAARDQLKKLLDEKAAADNKKDAAAKSEKVAAEGQVSAEKSEVELEKKVAIEENEHEEAVKSSKDEAEDVKKAEDDLAKAAEKLSKFRKGDAKSSATRKSMLLAVLACLAIAFTSA